MQVLLLALLPFLRTEPSQGCGPEGLRHVFVSEAQVRARHLDRSGCREICLAHVWSWSEKLASEEWMGFDEDVAVHLVPDDSSGSQSSFSLSCKVRVEPTPSAPHFLFK